MSLRLELQKSFTCPNCWKSLEPADLLWVSSHPDLRGDPFLGEDALKRFLPSRFDIEGFALDAKGTRCQSLACPTCHLTVPRILTEVKPVVVSVLGAPSSGKSYFLASSIWQLRQKLHAFNVTFTDADPVANRILSGYEKKLFLNDKPDQVVAIPKTEEDGELYQQVDYGDRLEMYGRPFVFAIRPTDSHVHLGSSTSIRRESRALCLYDNAGEHFQAESSSELSPATDHLALSEALIFVLDLLQHPQFRTLCRKQSNDPQLNDSFTCHRQDEILLEAAKRIRIKANLASHEKFTRPLIVAVNKYDVWSHLIPGLKLREIFPYVRAGEGAIALNLTMLREVSRHICDLVRRSAPEIVSACESFCEDVLFIPVSPQGCSPEQQDGSARLGVRPEDLQPVWAEVPLIYSLNKAKCSLIPSAEMSARPGTEGNSDDDDPPSPRILKGSA